MLLLSLGLGPPANGQELLTLDEAVARAAANHPRLAAASERIHAAEGAANQAELRPNPRVYIQSENWRIAGATPQPLASTFTDQFLYGSQLLEMGGKRERRMELASAGIRVAEVDREVIGQEIAARVKLAYWAAAGAQQVVDLLSENQQNLRQSVDYHAIQVREGAIAEADLARVKLEATRSMVELENAMREAGMARIALFREMGETAFPDVRLSEPGEAMPLPPAVDIATVLQSRPDVRRARQAVAQAQANVRLQQAEAKADVEVIAGYKRTAGFNTLIWGLQLPLPIRNKNQGNIAAAGSFVRALEGEAAAVEAQVRAEVEAARRDVESRRQRLAGLMSESLRTADEVVQIARAAYREGGTDLLRLLDAERTHIETEVLNARLLTEYRQSLVTLETAMGGIQ